MNSIQKILRKKMNNIILLWYFIYFIIFNVSCLSGLHAYSAEGYQKYDESAGPVAISAQHNEPHIRHHHEKHHHHHHPSPHQEPEQLAYPNQKARSMWAILNNGNSIDQNNEQKNDHHVHHPKPKSKENCLKCQDTESMSENEIKELRIEYVKNQILKKLRLTERPNVSASNIPREVLEGATLNTNNEEEIEQRPPPEFFAKATQKILFPYFDDEVCKKMENPGSSMCFSVDIPSDYDPNVIESAELWVLKNQHLRNRDKNSLVFSEAVEYRRGFIPLAFTIHPTNSSEDWIKVDIAKYIIEWIKDERLHHTFHIRCDTCDSSEELFSLESNYRPFIVINMHAKNSNKRQRRSLDCSAGITDCCREKLYISFEEIGWNDWIIHPPGYDAYFCRGTCSTAATITMSGSPYRSVITKYSYNHTQKHNSSRTLDKVLQLQPCCTGTQYSSLQLFHMETNSSGTRKTLPSMVVEACGCM